MNICPSKRIINNNISIIECTDFNQFNIRTPNFPQAYVYTKVITNENYNDELPEINTEIINEAIINGIEDYNSGIFYLNRLDEEYYKEINEKKENDNLKKALEQECIDRKERVQRLYRLWGDNSNELLPIHTKDSKCACYDCYLLLKNQIDTNEFKRLDELFENSYLDEYEFKRYKHILSILDHIQNIWGDNDLLFVKHTIDLECKCYNCYASLKKQVEIDEFKQIRDMDDYEFEIQQLFLTEISDTWWG